MTKVPRTPGEVWFEGYLGSQQIPFEFEKEHPGKKKKPDYAIEWNGKTVLFDVKDFDPPKTVWRGFYTLDPYPAVREKIEQGRDKFKEYKEFCCVLVLYNRENPNVMLESPDIMLGAMYGDSGFTFPFNTKTGAGDASQLRPAFLGRGKMVRPKLPKPQNTTISALVTLGTIKPHYLLLAEAYGAAGDGCTVQDCQAELERKVPSFNTEWALPRVIVWHNAVARIPFPKDLFCGPYDTHFGVVGNGEEGLAQQITYRGSSLPERVKV